MIASAVLLVPYCLSAQSNQVCPRFPVGTTIAAPEDLFSQDGVLRVDFQYQTTTDQNGNIRFCFTASDGAQSPTLHVNPGDRILMSVTNAVAAETGANPTMSARLQHMHPSPSTPVVGAAGCGTSTMTAESVNVHFHRSE